MSGMPAKGGALAHRFRNRWGAAPSYEARDGGLYHEGQPTDTYEPALHPELAPAVAKLRRGTDRDIVNFARRWGHLGYDTLLAQHRGDYEAVPDPLDWIRLHAQTVHLCLALLRYIQRGDAVGLEKRLRLLRGPTTYSTLDDPTPRPLLTADDMWPWVVYAARLEPMTGDWQMGKKQGAMWLGRRIVADIVTNNLSGLRQTLRTVDDPARFGADEPTRFMLGFTFAALVEVVYWHVGRLAEQQDSVGVCEWCGEFFHRTHGKERYCPDVADPKQRRAQRAGPRVQSRCGRNARAFETRLKARGEQPQKGKADV